MTKTAHDPLLSELTTMGVGGPARRMLVANTHTELLEFARELSSEDESWCILAGGSNSLFRDDGFAGTVLVVRSAGIEELQDDDSRVTLRVQAGHNWDEFVAYAVDRGLSGVEALSGIPGSVGAAPIQNIGAYGQEVSSALKSVEFFDTETGEVLELPVEELELGYRDSIFKRGRHGVIVSVVFTLHRDAGAEVALSQPVQYAQLATALGVELGTRVPIQDVRAQVLALRSAKGMVYSPDDLDSHGAGSFFMNPVVSEAFARQLPDSAPRWPAGEVDGVPVVKLSAAWLIEHAGIQKGYALPGSAAALSTKHSLAITNRGGATAEQVAELARFIATRVLSDTGILLLPEPVSYGLEL